MTRKKQRKKSAKRYRRLFKVDFVASFRYAKDERLPLSAVHPSLEIYDDVEFDGAGYMHRVTKVRATDGELYTFLDELIW
jgi:hypothetical protein